MIPMKIAIRKSFKGSFLLQPKISLTNPSPLIPEPDDKILQTELEVFQDII
jgi:hypothetical protein